MSLRDEMALYTELSGNDGNHTPIGIIGAYLDGYKKGKEEAQPEIIRCKDCKHAKITADGKYMKYCSQWDVDDALYLDSRFFCGYAERRTDEPDDIFE